MPEPPDEPAVHLPWVQRPRLLAAFVGVCMVLVVVAFIAGRFVRSESGLPEASTPTVGPVYAKVVKRIVQHLPSRSGVVTGRGAVPVPAPAVDESGVARSIITRATVRVGQTVSPGQLLSVVSGRPVFLLQLPVPLYRPLHDGDVGDDVREVQRALSDVGVYRGSADGEFGPITQAAIARLYQEAGFSPLRKIEDQSDPVPTPASGGLPPTPVAKVWLPIGEVFGIAQDFAVVSEVTARGSVLTGEGAAIAQNLSPDRGFRHPEQR